MRSVVLLTHSSLVYYSLIRFTWGNSLRPQPPFGLGTNREAAAHWDNNNHHSTVHDFAAGRRNHAPHQTH